MVNRAISERIGAVPGMTTPLGVHLCEKGHGQTSIRKPISGNINIFDAVVNKYAVFRCAFCSTRQVPINGRIGCAPTCPLIVQ